MRQIASENGFTLMEVLVAMSVTAAVLTGAFLSFRTSMDLSRDLQVRQETASMGRMTMRVIRDDLLSLCPPWDEELRGAFLTSPPGALPAFCTAASLSPGSDAGFALRRSVDYTLQGQKLVRTETGAATRVGEGSSGQPLEVTLCDGVTDLRFEYYEGRRPEASWDSAKRFTIGRDALPRRIGVQLRLRDAQGREVAYSMEVRPELGL